MKLRKRLSLYAVLLVTGLGLSLAARLTLERRTAAAADAATAELVSSRLRLETASEAAAARQRLVRLLWGDSVPATPPLRPPRRAVEDARFDAMPGLARLDRLDVVMDFGLTTQVRLFQPASPNGRAVIFHAGHGEDIDTGAEAIAALLAADYTVAAFTMPLQAPNSQPTVEFPDRGPLRLVEHGQLARLRPERGHPIRYFVEPVIAVTDHLESNGVSGLSIIGVSGGGWTATLAAAIDPRIRLSIPVAASYPRFLREPGDETGDWEQMEPALYDVTGYLDLYMLGALEPERSQLQIINRDDPCCFGGTRWTAYSDSVADRLDGLDGGRFDVFMDTTHQEHALSTAAIARILTELRREAP